VRCILPTLPHLAELLHSAFFIQGSGADPTLVINLLSSLPGSIETSTVDDNGRAKRMNLWNSQDEAHQEELRRAEQKLDNFMNEVITLQAPTLHISIAHPCIISGILRCALTPGDHPESYCIQSHRHLRRSQGRLPTLRFLQPRHGASGDLLCPVSTLRSLTLPPPCLPHRKLVRATLQANERAQFTVIAFVAIVANAAKEQKGPDLHPRVDNYIVIQAEDDESKGHMNRLKKAAIRFLTKPVAEGGKELPCLVSCLKNPHGRAVTVTNIF